MSDYVATLMEAVKAKNPAQPEFHQAVEEVVESIWPVLDKRPEYRKHKIVERIVEPERVIMFRVPWVDDSGEVVEQHDVPIGFVYGSDTELIGNLDSAVAGASGRVQDSGRVMDDRHARTDGRDRHVMDGSGEGARPS